jgi:preprotein translocase subunit SecG
MLLIWFRPERKYMEIFLTIVHVVVCLGLIGLVLLQDSKSGSLGGAFGGGSSNSVLGATGAATLAQKMTRWLAVLFACTSLGLTVLSSRGSKSVLDSTVLPAATAPATPAVPAAATESATPAAAPAATEAPAAGTPSQK